MAPFIVNHPILLNNWILARENSLKKIREIKSVGAAEVDIFLNCLNKSLKNITSWSSESLFQQKKINELIIDLKKIRSSLEQEGLNVEYIEM